MLKKADRKFIEIFFINFLSTLYLIRTVFPVLKEVFVFFFTIGVVYYSFSYRKSLLDAILRALRCFFPHIILAILIVIALLFSKIFHLTVVKDLVNATVLISLFILYFLVVTDVRDNKLCVDNFIFFIVISGLVISIARLAWLLDLEDYFKPLKWLLQNSAQVDTNFLLLPVLFCLLGITYFYGKTNSYIIRIILLAVTCPLTLIILFTGSRRGIMVFLVVLAVIIISHFWSRVNPLSHKSEEKISAKYSSLSVTPVFAVSFTIFFLFIYFFFTSFSFKSKTISHLGVTDPEQIKQNISVNIFRYISVIFPRISFEQFHDKIWTWGKGFDLRDPESGWGMRKHKVMFPIEGENSDIVPFGVRGYLLDNTTNFYYSPTDDICESYTLVNKINPENGKHIKAVAYCFVSDSFDIDAAFFTVGFSSIAKHKVTGYPTSVYDMNRKGTWQRLQIEFSCVNGNIPLYLTFRKYGVKDFRSLKGYIVFAYPHVEENSPVESLNIRTGNIKTFLYNKSSFFPIFSITNDVRKSFENSQHYLRNTDSLFLTQLSDSVLSFTQDRLLRWRFALNIFTTEYNLKQQFFGGGFDFLNLYGQIFFHDKRNEDYPHNPFLHILLYSGIVGLLIYCFFLYKVFYYYIKYIKEYPLLFIFFLITFFFAFFSSGSPFDPPVFGFFSILPFFIHSVHKRDKECL